MMGERRVDRARASAAPRSGWTLCLSGAAVLLLGAMCTGCATRARGGPPGTVAVAAGYSEPTIPAPCATLTAAKHSARGILDAADEAELDTERIQSAIGSCAAGQAVRLVAAPGKDAFVSGPLSMVSDVSLWVDKGVTLFASRNPRDFDVQPGACGTDEFDESGGCRSLINVESVDNVGIVGEGTIDGRGGEPMIGGTATWWDVAQHAKDTNAKHSNPRLIDVKKARNFTLYKVSLYNSPKFHVVINAQGFVVWGVTVLTPSRATNSVGRPLNPHYARNTDGIDPSAATNGVIAYSTISTGDDQIAIKGGNSGPTAFVTIAHNHFGSGHGMSIGSETNGGVNNILVYDLSIDGAVAPGFMPKVDLNGIRIKSDSSRGGLVENITYRDVCIRDVVYPILLSPLYSKATGTMVPLYRNILLENVRAIRTPGTIVEPPVVKLLGFDASYLLDVQLDNVVVEGLGAEGSVRASFAKVELGPGPVSFPVSGDGVSVTNHVTRPDAAPNSCAGKFVKIAANYP
jgi:polygalacturonase